MHINAPIKNDSAGRQAALICFLFLIAFWAGAFVSSAFPAPSPAAAAEIEQLLKIVDHSGYVYERNGRYYSSREAAQHLRFKLDHRSPGIKTTEDFMDKLATRSSLSGEFYRVKTPSQKTLLRDYLYMELQRLRGEQLLSSSA